MAANSNAGGAQAHYYVGQALRDTGELDAAIRELQVAVQLQPDFTEAQNALGVLLQRSGNLDDAIASFQRVVQLQPENAEAHNNLGLARCSSATQILPSTNFRLLFACDRKTPVFKPIW